MAIRWLPWSAEAFERAREQRKPLLLSIATTWSGSCREMDRTSFADPVVAALVNARFVPIRVDADRRPDIGNRYTLGGWPTTAFLTADGELLGGGTYVDRQRLGDVLRRVADAFALRHDTLPPVGGLAADDHPGCAPEPPASLAARILDSFDSGTGAFGGPPCFPHAAPIHMALALLRGHEALRLPAEEASRIRAIATTALDALGWGGLYDDVDGGFFRCANGPGWLDPEREKLLDVNASMLALYCDAFTTLQLTRYRDRAADILRYLQTWLADPVDGGWAASQQADPAYYDACTPEMRAALPPPPVDPVLYADWNAVAVSAVLRAARVFVDDGLKDFAVKSLERALLPSYRPGAGVAHCVDGSEQVRGLLEDHIAMAAANLDAFEATGNIVYEMMAEELAHVAIRTMWDGERGGFFDRACGCGGADVGLLQRGLKPFVANCDAARVLRRLAVASGNAEFAERARRTLAAVAADAAAQGPLAAHYVIAGFETAGDTLPA
jgi:uncharacterized protein YyaL (SSP411 family)